jgi:uncharacterized membrane protein YebE (DUF533 family)
VRAKTILGVAFVGAVAYYLYLRWKDQQRAIAHPIDNQRITLQPVTFDPTIVGRTF